jgi:hypothetical protein
MALLEARKFDHLKSDLETSEVPTYDFGQFDAIKGPDN